MIIRPDWMDWDSKRLALEWLKARLDPYHFLTTFCYTLDQHDPVNPIKLIPQKQYIKFLVRAWQKCPLLVICKSRQMLVTWTFVCLYLWDAMFKYGRRDFFQSEKEEKANELIERVHFTHRFLPGKPYKIGAKYTYCRLRFPSVDSIIKGVPQGPDVIRQETASGVLSDEMAFQFEAERAYIAAKPTIDGGGRYTAISTPNGPNFFKRLVHDEQ